MSDEEITVKITTEADTDDLDALEEKLDNLNETQVSPEIDIDEVEGRIEELKEEIEFAHEYGFDSSEAEAELEELQEMVDELKAKLEEQPDMSGMESSLDGLSMMAVGDALQQYGSSAEGMAQQMNQASITVGQLATNTGIAEPQMRQLIASLSSADFPQEDAMAYVNALNQMGVSTNNLGSSATAMDIIGDATGMTADQTISLTQSLRGLGVSADNLPSAFNSIAYAQANVNGGAGTLTQVFKRQAGTLNEYGVSVDQATLMMEALSKKGVQGMKMGSALSDVLKENNGDLSAVEQELGLTAGTLTNASQVTGEYQGKLEDLAAEEGDHKTLLEQLNAAWQDVSLSISGITEPIMSFVGLGGQIAGFGSQMNGTWELMKKIKDSDFSTKMNNIKTSIKAAGDSAKNSATNFLTLSKRVLTAGYNALKSAGMWLAQKIQLIATTAWTYLTAAAQAFLNLIMSMNPIMLVVIALAALAAALIWAYYNVDWFRQMVDNAFATVQRFAQVLVSNITNAVNSFANIVQGIPRALENCLNWAYNLIMSNPLVQALQWLGEQAVHAFSVLGLGQGSPGKIFEAMNNELDWTEDAIYKSSLNDAGANLGASVGEGFNPNLQTANGSISQSTGNNITINIDNVDSEDRIQQIVQAVEDALKFDNLTAGRSV